MSPSAPRVLVVDDDPANLEMTERRLEAAGFDCLLAETGSEGLALARREPFDAVLLDLRLPDIDGMEVMEALHAIVPGLPILIMTAHGVDAIEREARDRGAADYLAKPVARMDLLAALHAAIAGRGSESR